jgi:DNA-binding NarL/FixJ family response regulator
MNRGQPMSEERVTAVLERYRAHAERFDRIAQRRSLQIVPASVVEAAPGSWAPELSSREIDVLRLAADGATSEDIAGALHLTEHTVKSHLKRIQSKLGARNRTHAVATALRTGLIP